MSEFEFDGHITQYYFIMKPRRIFLKILKDVASDVSWMGSTDNGICPVGPHLQAGLGIRGM